MTERSVEPTQLYWLPECRRGTPRAKLLAAGRWPDITSDEGYDAIILRNSADFCNAIACSTK